MKRVELPSPNFNDRSADKPVSILLLHYTGMETAAAALDRLCDPEAKVSAHYTVDEDGTVYAHVPEDRRAWHAGVSFWAGETDINGVSVGIEIVNPGHEFGYRPFPEAQIDAVLDLSREIVARHDISPARVIGHSDVAPSRKEDPGELFPWDQLAAAGIGLWPPALDRNSQANIRTCQENLRRFGYDCPVTGSHDADTKAVVTAMQRHFRPAALTGEIDGETAAVAAWLAKAVAD